MRLVLVVLSSTTLIMVGYWIGCHDRRHVIARLRDERDAARDHRALRASRLAAHVRRVS